MNKVMIVEFWYLNHSGKKQRRKIEFECIEFIREPGFGYQSGWFISGKCYDKVARRSFALNRIILDEKDVPPLYKLVKWNE